MNKEEILIKRIANSALKLGWNLAIEGPEDSQEAVRGMVIGTDEYIEIIFPKEDKAKQQSIAFAEWLGREGFVNYDGADRWISPENGNDVYETKWLYDHQFTDWQNKQNG